MVIDRTICSVTPKNVAPFFLLDLLFNLDSSPISNFTASK